MKNKIFAFAVLGCTAGIWLAGCDKVSERKVEGVKHEVNDAKAEYLAAWQKFKTESEGQIKANEKRIDAFKEKMEKAGTKVKATYDNIVAELEQKNRDLKKKLEDHEEFMAKFKHDMDETEKTMKDLFKDKD